MGDLHFSEMMLTEKWIFVTGANGFLGGALIQRLSAMGCRVRALVRRPERAGEIADLPGVELVVGDVTDLQGLRHVLDGCGIVFHVAAAFSGLEQQVSVNIAGTRNTATAATEAGVARFVHVSSVAVYGYRQTGSINETVPPRPNHDPYSWTKATGEGEVRRIAEAQNMAYSIIRPAMIYGPRSGMWTGRMFALAKRNPTLFLGDGRGSAYPIHVDDVVDMMLVLAQHPAAAGETFNCAPDPSPTWRAFLGHYAALAGHDRWLGIPPGPLHPLAAVVARLAPTDHPLRDLPAILRYGESQTVYSMDKARDLLGWSPRVPLAKGIAGCADWLRAEGLL